MLRTLAAFTAAVLTLTGCATVRAEPARARPGLTGQVIATPAVKAAAVTPAATSAKDQAANKLLLGFTTAETKLPAAKASLAKLKVASPGSTAGYSRALFPHWRDASTWGWPKAPNDHCNARNAALYRDGVKVTMSATCTNLKGKWLDPYTAAWFTAVGDMDIDHMVPLAEAWRSGANSWTTTRRTQFANDPLVEVSVEDNANQSKGDKDPGSPWMPPNRASWCLYAKRWIAVKAKYALTVDSAEKAGLTSMLGKCTA